MRARGMGLPRGAPWTASRGLHLTNSALPSSLIFWDEPRSASGLAGIMTARVPTQLAGMLPIVAGMAPIDGRAWRRLASRSTLSPS